jgi:hypothetical protein
MIKQNLTRWQALVIAIGKFDYFLPFFAKIKSSRKAPSVAVMIEPTEGSKPLSVVAGRNDKNFPMKPPTIAPPMPNTMVKRQPLFCSPGVIHFARPPASKPKIM